MRNLEYLTILNAPSLLLIMKKKCDFQKDIIRLKVCYRKVRNLTKALWAIL